MTSENTASLLNRTIVWDNHACMPLRPHDDSFLPQIERHRRSGFDVVSLNVGFGENTPEEHLRMLAHLRAWFSRRPDRYLLVRGVEDIHTAKREGKLAIVFDIEGMNAVADQVSLVQAYYDLGVRWMLVAFNLPNRAGGGCVAPDPGLTAFGRSVIDEMVRVGMVVCCSHTGYRTAREVLEYCPTPVIFSHSNPRAVWDHPRNVPDELMLACAAKGGVVGLNGIGSYLGENDASTATFLKHVDYAIDLLGDEHVSLGLDYIFDPQELSSYVDAMAHTFPAQLGLTRDLAMIEPERLPDIVAGMMAHGHPAKTIQNVLGANLLRVAAQVWR